jgi:hypothetical protein
MASSSSNQVIIIINTQIEGYAQKARDAAASALARLGTANSYVERANGNLIAAQSSYGSALVSLNKAKTAYNSLADADISLVLGYKRNAIRADLSASQYRQTAFDNKTTCNYYADYVVSDLVPRMVTDVSCAHTSAYDASYNAARAEAASTSSDAYNFYIYASYADISANASYIDTSNAYSSANTFSGLASDFAVLAGGAYSGAFDSFTDVSRAYDSAYAKYNTDKFTNIALTLKNKVDIISNKKISAALDVSYALGYYVDASFHALTALTAYNNSAGYVTSALIYANDASGSAARAYSAYTRLVSSDVLTVSGYTVLAGQADISASYYRNLTYIADLSAIQFAISVSGQVLIMQNDVSYSLGYANDASANAVRATNAATSADASGYYHIAYSDYQFAYGNYTSAVSAHSSASIYSNNASNSATAAKNAYSSTLASYNDISDAYGRANTICVNNTDTTKSSTLNEYLSIIGTHQTHAAQEVSYSLGYYLDASNQNITALTAYNNSAGYVASTLQHANDASGSSIAAYNAYTRLLLSEQQPVVVDAAADYYTPAPFTSILAQTYTAPSTLTLASTLTTRNRYILGCNGGYLSIDSSFNLVLSSSLATYKDVMCKILEMDVSGTKIVEGVTYSNLRIDSDLDYLYSLDCSGTSAELKFSNNWGVGANTTCGYVQFAYNLDSKLLIAGIRQSISDSSYNHSVDTTFNPTTTLFYVNYTTGRFTLTSSLASASSFTLYNSPINCNMPSDFNPYQIPYVPNSRVPITSYVIGPKVKNTLSKMDSSIKTQNMKSIYLGQIDVSGLNWRTDLCGNAMLDLIYANVHSQGNSLRYDLSVYKSFRSGALNTKLGCNSIADGTLGQNTVPYVYYTLESDDSGKSHPFMVIASYSISDKPNRLLDVCRPPADGDTTYETDPVTRDITLQNYLTKIPMLDYGQVASLTENTMLSTLLAEYRPAVGEPAINTPSPYNFASISAIGIAIDGVAIYPLTNNTLHPAQSQAEITNTGIHIGRGMGLHYHADGQSAMSNNLNLYNSRDYVGHSHPPLIGFGLDGIALYGQYDLSYTNMHGNTVPLDQYGGHTHGTSPNAYGYHYHAHTVNSASLTGVVNNSSGVRDAKANPSSYNVRVLMKGAWAGNINTIPYFWDDTMNAPSFTIGTNNSKFVGMSPPPPR